LGILNIKKIKKKMNSKLFLVLATIALSGILSICLLISHGEIDFLRAKNTQTKGRGVSFPNDSIIYVKQPWTGNSNYDKGMGRDLYLTNGGKLGDDGLNRPLIYQNVIGPRTLRLTQVVTQENDPLNPDTQYFKIKVTMADKFKGNPITGYLAANSAGPVVQYPEEQAVPEYKMMYYWRVEKYEDGFILVNRWQKVNRYTGFSKQEENIKASTVKLPNGSTVRVQASVTIAFRPGWVVGDISLHEKLPMYARK
jgi:hypothetical protein